MTAWESNNVALLVHKNRPSTTVPTTGCRHARYTHARTHARTLHARYTHVRRRPGAGSAAATTLGGSLFYRREGHAVANGKGGGIYFQSKGRKLRFRHGAGGSCSSSSRRAPEEHNGAAQLQHNLHNSATQRCSTWQHNDAANRCTNEQTKPNQTKPRPKSKCAMEQIQHRSYEFGLERPAIRATPPTMAADPQMKGKN